MATSHHSLFQIPLSNESFNIRDKIDLKHEFHGMNVISLTCWTCENLKDFLLVCIKR